MFLSRRITQAEYSDALDRPASEVTEFYQSLAEVNRLFHSGEPFQRVLPKAVGPDACRNLSILDLGAGDGSLGTMLTRWAAEKNGWDWRVIHLDLNRAALRMAADGNRVVGSALALPFRNDSVDAVIASQMTHHLLSDEEIILHLREAWRVARRTVLLVDLHRGPVLYTMLRLFFLVRRYPKHFQYDALVSVRRAFRVRELRQLAAQAGLARAQVRLDHISRVILEARKSP